MVGAPIVLPMADEPELPRGFLRDPVEPAPPEDEAPVVVVVDSDDENGDASIDPESGALKIESSDGSVTIDLNPQGPDKSKNVAFGDNLAEVIDEGELARIASELLQAIEADDQSRQEWLETRAKGIDMLGFKLEEPRSDVGSNSAPVEGMSVVRHTLLPEACIRFQSNAAAELLPAVGPVKVRNDRPIEPPGQVAMDAAANAIPGMGDNGGPSLDDTVAEVQAVEQMGSDQLAECLEKDLNHYLTVVDRGYRPDTDRMLFWVGFGGCSFKKIYHDPIKRIPISRSVEPEHLIVANDANDIDDAGRVTHRMLMRPSVLRRMQLAGAYRDINLGAQPQVTPNTVEAKTAEVQGFSPTLQRPEDQLHTIYECYVELDLQGFEHKDGDGKPTGLALPYRVTIEKDSRTILEIRRNWREDDDNCLAKKVFVKYPFVPAFGFYEIGLLHILGNANRALTAAWRLMLDTGMFANFPGSLIADTAGRQQTNEFRVPPGGAAKVQVPAGKSIRDMVMPLPYSTQQMPALLGLAQHIEQSGQRLGGTAELPVGEGKQDAPVGTTLALIEQATKMLAAVHVRLHAAQAEEFQLLKERFQEDPEALWRHNRRPARKWEVAEFLKALDDYDLVPAADPNTPSHMHRIMKAVAIKQLQAMNPGLYDAKEVDSLILSMIGISDYERLFAKQPSMPAAPAAPPMLPPDPAKMADVAIKKEKAQNDFQLGVAQLQLKQRELAMEEAGKVPEAQADAQQAQQEQQARVQEAAVESADRAADRQNHLQIAQIKEDTERMKLGAAIAHAHQEQQNQQPGLSPPSVP